MITDKMVEAAWKAYCGPGLQCHTAMRAALEAALAVKKSNAPGLMKDVDTLRWLSRDNSGKFSEGDKELLLRVASCIEDLSRALRPFANIELPECVPDDAMIIITDVSGGIIVDPSRKKLKAKYLRNIRATLTRWGLEK